MFKKMILKFKIGKEQQPSTTNHAEEKNIMQSQPLEKISKMYDFGIINSELYIEESIIEMLLQK